MKKLSKGIFMNTLQNLHTHSRFCDGADTPEEMIQSALAQNLGAIGFSGHAYAPFSPYCAGKPDLTDSYKAEIRRLQEKYRAQLPVFLGLEVEMLAAVDIQDYDYLLGAVHYLKEGDTYIGFDRDADTVAQIIHRHFGGNGMAYAKAYYKTLANLPDYGDFDIVAHFDIITKHCQTHDFFDTDSKEYLHAAFEAIEALAGKIPYFEVNTGAIARGYRTTPYPHAPIIKELFRRGFGAVITSDCHDRRQLTCHFDQAAQLLQDCGCREKYILTQEGFIPVPLIYER